MQAVCLAKQLLTSTPFEMNSNPADTLSIYFIYHRFIVGKQQRKYTDFNRIPDYGCIFLYICQSTELNWPLSTLAIFSNSAGKSAVCTVSLHLQIFLNSPICFFLIPIWFWFRTCLLIQQIAVHFSFDSFSPTLTSTFNIVFPIFCSKMMLSCLLGVLSFLYNRNISEGTSDENCVFPFAVCSSKAVQRLEKVNKLWSNKNGT